MKYLSVAIIFWLTIWTVPRAGVPGWGRCLIAAWGFYLCHRILTTDRHG